MKDDAASRPVRIFISYAPADQEQRTMLWKHLRRFHGGMAELWDDQLIEPGQKWKEEIWTRLHEADLILFLMSSDSLNSDFIWDVQLKKTYERCNRGEVVFIPIYLKECNWTEIRDLSQFQIIPEGNRPIVHNRHWTSPDEPYTLVARKVIDKVKSIWQRINNAILEQGRVARFSGVAQFLKTNPHFFEMTKILRPVPSNEPDDVLYFIGIANHMKNFSNRFQRAEKNGKDWLELTLADIEFFYDICEQLETVFLCSDYVQNKLRSQHQESIQRVQHMAKHITDYIGGNSARMDYYRANYALPASYSLNEYQVMLRELAEESISAQ